MPIVGLETRRPYFRVWEPLKPAKPALRETEHSALVTRVENFKKEVADLKAQLAEKDQQIAALTEERDRLKTQLGESVPALTQRIAALEDTVAEKTYALKAGQFVPPKL